MVGAPVVVFSTAGASLPLTLLVANALSLPSVLSTSCLRLIGRKFTNSEVVCDMKHFSFKDVDGGDAKPVSEFEYRGETKHFVSVLYVNLYVILMLNVI